MPRHTVRIEAADPANVENINIGFSSHCQDTGVSSCQLVLSNISVRSIKHQTYPSQVLAWCANSRKVMYFMTLEMICKRENIVDIVKFIYMIALTKNIEKNNILYIMNKTKTELV